MKKSVYLQVFSLYCILEFGDLLGEEEFSVLRLEGIAPI